MVNSYVANVDLLENTKQEGIIFIVLNVNNMG